VNFWITSESQKPTFFQYFQNRMQYGLVSLPHKIKRQHFCTPFNRNRQIWKSLSNAQWEHFIQKGGQNFFLFRFLLFGVKIMFSTILCDPRRFFGKIQTGQFVGSFQATALSSLHG
jgi:hypothetical protein